jgi:protoporphyrin/coproporphyrin ferrochelatase
LEITCAQASELERCLNDILMGFKVYVGMRHWKPYIRDVVAQIAVDGFQRGIALCMAPHASKMSTGAYLAKLHEAQEALSTPLRFEFIESWYDQPFLIQALTSKVRAAAEQFSPVIRPQIHYLFTAHSLPAVLQEQGDPYANQLQQTARLLAQELNLASGQWSFAYQSAGAAGGRWLGPAIEEILPEYEQAGKRNILVTPVGFMSDHVEILFDLDIEAQEIAKKHGVRLVRSESLNATPNFILGLAKFIMERSALKENGTK